MIDFSSIHFPAEGTVTRVVHFSDMAHQYAFSFASPYIYDRPTKYKARNAFLITKQNPFNPNSSEPDEIYAYFIQDGNEVAPRVVRSKNISGRMVHLFDGADQPLGSLEVVTSNNRLFGFNPNYPNRIFDENGNVTGFAHYQPKRNQKALYQCGADFDLERPYRLEDIRELEGAEKIRLMWTYGLEQKTLDFKSRLEAMFSPSKKAESILNQIDMKVRSENDRDNLRYLVAMVAYFWTTVIDLPVLDN